jgi:hypothetical protein
VGRAVSWECPQSRNEVSGATEATTSGNTTPKTRCRTTATTDGGNSARSLGMLAAGIGRIRKTAARHSRHASLSDLNTHWAACFYSRQTWIIGRPHLSGSVPGGPESARLADSSAQHTAGQTVAAEAGKLSCPSSGAGVFTAEDNVNLQSPSSQFC